MCLEKTVSADSNSSEEVSTKDSGLGSRSPVSGGERRLGRGRLVEDLSSFSGLSIGGRGRSKLFEEDNSQSGNQNTGRGRATLFQRFAIESSSSSSFSSGETASQPAQSEKLPEMEEKVKAKLKEEKSEFFSSLKTTHGSMGKPVKLACNYIPLESDPEKGVYVYEVRFAPNVDSTSLRMKYLNEHRDKFGGTKTFDGVTLYLPILLKDKLTTFVSHSVADGSDIEIRILYKRKECLKNCIHLYNILFDRVMKTLKYVRFNRKQFDPTCPKIIPQQKLEIWPGYVTAVDEYEGGLMLCCDVSHRLLCQKTVLEMLIDINRSHSGSFQDAAKKALLGSVVITRYNNRTYRIDDICFDKNPMSTFITKDGPVSYSEYYIKNHNIVIKDKGQPLLISIKKQKVPNKAEAEDLIFCLIPEICHLTGLRDDMRSDFKLMREIATFTRVSPNQRLLALEKFYTSINQSPEAKQILNDWGLTLKQSHNFINGRCYDPENIYFKQKFFSAGPQADFSKHAVSNELLEVVHIHNWLLIHVRNDSRVAQSLCEHIDRNTRAMGMNVQKPKIVALQNDRVDTYVKAIRDNVTKDTQIVVCITPTSRDDRYSSIKKICCVEMPIPSQVINARTLCNESKNRSIVQKILLQMNCKLGGSLWSIKIPFKEAIMICGIDSYHDAHNKSNSVAAFVASINHNYTKWYSKAVIQTKREEIVNGLCSSFISALLAFRKENSRYPDSVIIYRDGVGDGQLSLCESYELPQFESACNRMLNHSVKITFIVVQKRINTRYFILQGKDANNPPPGTVVDNHITRSNFYDFFLVSQSVRQGTVSPCHYIVLRDDSVYTPDIIQRLTYKLCFLYYNWPGTIRIPACCQYAHKMAYLVGQNVRRTPAEELCDKLFYL